LSDAANKKRHYSHPAIDVWLVFDLLACDTDLKGNFTYSQSGYANDHDVRINEISELTKDRQAEVNQLKSDVRDLELANQRLKGELDQTRAEFKTLSAEFAQVRQQLVKIPSVEQRLGQTEQTAQQLIDAYGYVRGALDNNANLMNALFANLRPPAPVQSAMATAPAPEPAETNGWFGRKRRSEPTPSAPQAAMHAGPPANAPNGAPAGAVVLNSPVTVPHPVPQSAATAMSSHILGIPSVRAPGMASGPGLGLPNGSGHNGLPSAAASSAMAPLAAAPLQAAAPSANAANGIKPAPAAAPAQAAAAATNGSANGLANGATNGGAPVGQSPAPAAKPLAMVKA
jgi:outer membrane murein-binding lipoprotein Lpp